VEAVTRHRPYHCPPNAGRPHHRPISTCPLAADRDGSIASRLPGQAQRAPVPWPRRGDDPRRSSASTMLPAHDPTGSPVLATSPCRRLFQRWRPRRMAWCHHAYHESRGARSRIFADIGVLRELLTFLANCHRQDRRQIGFCSGRCLALRTPPIVTAPPPSTKVSFRPSFPPRPSTKRWPAPARS